MIEISEWVEVPKRNKTIETNVASNLNISAEASPANSSEVDQESLDAENDTNKSNSTIDEQGSADVITEKIFKKRTFRVPLKVHPG